jgi:uncharacterized membrane protein
MEKGKAAAVISYITPLGWLIGLIIHSGRRTPLSAFHLRQSLLLHITSLLLYGIQVSLLYVPVIGWLLGFLMLLAGIVWLFLWAIGIIFAFGGEARPVPILGRASQRIFSKLG